VKEATGTFYENEPHRIMVLLRAGLQVRHKRELDPQFQKPRPLTKPKPQPLTFESRSRKKRGPATTGFVYVFAAGAHVKVGISETDVQGRWNSIRSCNPLLEPAAYVSPPVGDLARKVEQAAHRSLSHCHVSGEWFLCAPENAIETVKGLIQGLSIGGAHVDRK
jgi:T5orf172 domain-containing protein